MRLVLAALLGAVVGLGSMPGDAEARRGGGGRSKSYAAGRAAKAPSTPRVRRARAAGFATGVAVGAAVGSARASEARRDAAEARREARRLREDARVRPARGAYDPCAFLLTLDLDLDRLEREQGLCARDPAGYRRERGI